jgi:transmembrane sensor
MDSARIEEEAAEWLARRDSCRWSEADENAFEVWQSRATANRIAVIRLRTAWQHADRLQALGAGVPRGEIPRAGCWRLSTFFGHAQRAPEVRSRSGVSWARRIGLRALAAAAILMTAGVAGWYVIEQELNTYRTSVGEIRSVVLEDGSTVTLNTNTAIHVSFDGRERRVELKRGESYFEVEKDAARPFVVSASGRRIVAVGTRFSVLRKMDETRVVVTEGLVRVEDPDEGRAMTPAALPAGSVARAGSAGVSVERKSVADAEVLITWRSGFIVLRDTPLIEAVAEFNRYNTKQLVVADPALAGLLVAGNLRATNVEAFVRVLTHGFPVVATDEGDRIVLTGR